MRRNLKTIRQQAEEGPQSEGQLRWQLFNAKSNGLEEAGAIVRIGRRVYLDVDRYDDWIESQNQRVAAVA